MASMREDRRVPELARQVLELLAAQLDEVGRRIAEVDARIMAWHRTNPVSRRLVTIPGIGPLIATAIAATVPDPDVFRGGREFAAWLGLVPRQTSTGAAASPVRASRQGRPRRSGCPSELEVRPAAIARSLVQVKVVPSIQIRCRPGISSISLLAASRSARPVAWVRHAATTRPERLSMSRWPMKHSLPSLPAPLRNSRASASVVEACVSLRRRSPWKSRSPLRPPPGGSSPSPLGRKLFIEAQAWINVQSTEKCSRAQKLSDPRVVEHRRQELGRDLALKQPVTVGRERGRMPDRIVGPEPTNQRNSRLQSSCSINSRSERTE